MNWFVRLRERARSGWRRRLHAAGRAPVRVLAEAPGRVTRDRPLAAALAGLACLLVLGVAVLPAHARGAGPPAGPPAGATLAVADLRGDALVILDTATGATRRIPLPGGPHEMLRLPDGRIVLSLWLAGRLAVVNTATGAVTADAIGGMPHGLALSHGVLSVTDESRDVLRRFAVDAGAPSTWHELASLPEAHWPHVVVDLPDGTPVVADAGASMLQIGAHAFAVSTTPEAVAVSPRTGDVAVAGSFGGAVQVFTRTGRLVWQRVIGGRPVRLAYAPDGRTLAVSVSADHAVALIDTGAGHAVRWVRIGGSPDGLAFDPSGRFLYAGDLSAGRVTLIDVARGAAIRTYATGKSAGALLRLGPAAP